MSKITNKKSSFFNDTYPQIYIKKMFKTYMVFHWITHDDMEFDVKLKGPFLVEISSNETFYMNSTYCCCNDYLCLQPSISCCYSQLLYAQFRFIPLDL